MIDKYITVYDHEIATFEIYILVKSLTLTKKLSLSRAQKIIGQMIGAAKTSWRVVGISAEALNCFREVGFQSRPLKRVERAHFHHRRNVFQEILKLEFSNGFELLEYCKDRDQTVLCLYGK